MIGHNQQRDVIIQCREKFPDFLVDKFIKLPKGPAAFRGCARVDCIFPEQVMCAIHPDIDKDTECPVGIVSEHSSKNRPIPTTERNKVIENLFSWLIAPV